MQSVRASINLVLVAEDDVSSLGMETDSMDAIVDSFPSIKEERPVDVPAERDTAAFFGTRRDDRRDMLQCVLLLRALWYEEAVTKNNDIYHGRRIALRFYHVHVSI